SSGEKQLLIILSEALLQNGKRCLYLADEPELSLHVSWQEKIVNSIFEINKNVQIIFATHSPDVVSWRQDKTIFMSGE
ncbi:AAA family ATPase, partial [Escherichia coli]|uniref:AAA family ATPase n=3 Tax=Enterobacteriaceae TaxID=543 RepID=UPI001299B25C